MADDYTLDEVLDKIKRIGIEKLGNIKSSIGRNDKLPDDNIFKNELVVMKCVIKDGDELYPQLLLEETLHGE